MKKFFRDRVILTVLGGILLFWCIATCQAVTGLAMTGSRYSRSDVVVLSDRDRKEVWFLPILLTVVWSPIIGWRVWKIRSGRAAKNGR